VTGRRDQRGWPQCPLLAGSGYRGYLGAGTGANVRFRPKADVRALFAWLLYPSISSSTCTETSLVRDVHVGGKLGAIFVMALLALWAWYLKGLEQTPEFGAARSAYVQAHPEASGARFAICYWCGFRTRSFADEKQLRFGMRVSLPDGTETALVEASTKGDQAPSIKLD
jgi:hypothetical protein